MSDFADTKKVTHDPIIKKESKPRSNEKIIKFNDPSPPKPSMVPQPAREQVENGPPLKSDVDVRLDFTNATMDMKQLTKAHWNQAKKLYENKTKMLVEAELVLQAVFDLINFKPNSWRDVCNYFDTGNLYNQIISFKKDQLVE